MFRHRWDILPSQLSCELSVSGDLFIQIVSEISSIKIHTLALWLWGNHRAFYCDWATKSLGTSHYPPRILKSKHILPIVCLTPSWFLEHDWISHKSAGREREEGCPIDWHISQTTDLWCHKMSLKCVLFHFKTDIYPFCNLSHEAAVF